MDWYQLTWVLHQVFNQNIFFIKINTRLVCFGFLTLFRSILALIDIHWSMLVESFLSMIIGSSFTQNCVRVFLLKIDFGSSYYSIIIVERVCLSGSNIGNYNRFITSYWKYEPWFFFSEIGGFLYKTPNLVHSRIESECYESPD